MSITVPRFSCLSLLLLSLLTPAVMAMGSSLERERVDTRLDVKAFIAEMARKHGFDPQALGKVFA